MKLNKNYNKMILIVSIILLIIGLIIFLISRFLLKINFTYPLVILVGIILSIIFSIFLIRSYKKQSLFFNFIDDLKIVFGFSDIIFYLKILLTGTIFIVFSYIFSLPYKTNIEKDISKNGIDIVLTLDVSTSMDVQDLKPTRLEAAKKIINQFLDKLKNDRVGLVVFAGKPFVSLPLTFDYDIVKETIKSLDTKIINQNNNYFGGTAIGDALLMSKNLFKPVGSGNKIKRTKIVILLTDGDANKGVNPLLAAQYLSKNGIKIYTIGIGSKQGGIIQYKVGPFTQYAKIPPLKETTLRQIAQISNGKFFRATDNESLKKIFDEIAKLEKTKIKEKKNIIKQTYLLPFIILNIILIAFFSYLRFKEI